MGVPLLRGAMAGEPLRSDLDAYMDEVNEYVTGGVAVKLYKGSVTPVPHAATRCTIVPRQGSG